MVFQYQYQYQYGVETQEGFIYSSFLELLKRVPTNVVYISLLIAVVPLAFYVWKNRFRWIIERSHGYFGSYLRRKEEDLMKRRVDAEYNRLSKTKKISGAGELVFLVFLGIFGSILMTKLLFFSLVLTDSMLMTLAPADLVLVEKFSTDIQVGDIVLFNPPDRSAPIIHRVISTENGKIRTKGDNSLQPDDWLLDRGDIIGKAVTIKDHPVVVKNLGWYIFPTKIYIPGSDPIYEFVRDMITYVHENGIILVVVIILFGIIISFGKKEEGRPYYST